MNSKFVAFVIGVVLILTTAAVAQLPTATIVGQVMDPTNAVVVGAKVEVRDMSTNQKRTAVTTDKGEYTVSALLPGTYEVTITQTGFKKLVESNLDLGADQTARLDAKLEVGGGDVTRVDVKESDSSFGQIQGETSSKGDVIAPVEIAEMPLDGRDPTDLVFSIAGVVPQEEGGKGTNFTTNGARSDATNVMIEGLNNTNPRDAGAEASPPLDSLQEFKMQTSGYSAQYGRVAGGVVNMVMKRGGNQLHGGLFEFVRNDAFDAGNWFDAAGQKSKLRRNQFGATIGGPVTIPHIYNGRDKTFFFGSWESYRQVQGSDSIGTVPSLGERGLAADGVTPLGYLDFSKSFNVNNGLVLAATGKNALMGGIYPNNHVPLSMLNPVAVELLNFYPLPNYSQGGNNYRAYAETPDQWDNVVIKIDQQISAKDEFSARALGKQEATTNPFSGSGLGLFGATTKHKEQMYGITETRIFTPTLINEFRLGLTRMKSDETALDGGTNWARALGMCPAVPTPGVTQCPKDDPNFAEFPKISPSGYMILGDSTTNPVRYTTNNYNLNDVLTWNKGKHTVKFGADALRVQYFQATNSNYSGTVSFSGKTSQNAMYDFLIGKPNSVSLTVGAPTNHIFNNNYAAFAQDDYKVLSSLTLNLGLRYELEAMPYESGGQWSSYVPSLGKTVYAANLTPAIQNIFNTWTGIDSSLYAPASQYGYPKTLVHPNYKRFAPRVGFAWRPFSDNKTVIRAGYGIFYTGSRLSALRTDLAGQFPFSQALSYSGPSLDNAFNVSPTMKAISSAKGIDLNPKSAYLQSWNFTVENEIGGGVTLEMGYTGSKGTHLGRKIDINQYAPALYIPGSCDGTVTAGCTVTNPYTANGPITAFHPVNPGFSSITYYTFNSDSFYNAGTVTVRKQFTHGLMFRVNYTFAKALDDASGMNYSGNGGFSGAQNSQDPNGEYGRADFDRRHTFNGNFVYAIPLHSNVLTRGWQLAGSFTLYSGAPITPQYTNPSSNYGVATRPNRICDGTLSNPTPTMWFNTACFINPTDPSQLNPAVLANELVGLGASGLSTTNLMGVGVFGNSGRNVIDGPGNIVFNTAFSRNFRIGENGKLQFRWEVFNIMNHPNFNLPNDNVDTPGVGSITKAKDPRVMQLGVKYSF